MSAPREENATDRFVKQYLTARLEIAEAKGLVFEYTDQFVDHLNSEGGLDNICRDWIRFAPNEALRELLRDHHGRHGKAQAGAARAPSLNTVGPSVPQLSNVSDSAYDPGPGSPMVDLRMHSLVSNDDR